MMLTKNRNILIILSFVVIAIAVYFSFNNIKNILRSSQEIEHTVEALDEIDKVDLLLTKLQASRRSYVITRDTVYIIEYMNNRERLYDNLAVIKKRYSRYQDIHGINDLDSLIEAITVNQMLTFKDTSLYSTNSQDILLKENQIRYKKVNSIFDTIRVYETRYMSEQQINTRTDADEISTVITIGALLVLIILIIFIVIFSRRYRESKAKENRSVNLISELITNMPLVLFTIDKDGKYLFIKGKDPDNRDFNLNEFAGKTVWEVYDDPNIQELFNKALAGEEVREFITLNDDICYDTYLKPIRNKSGKITRVLGVMMDVTEKKHAERDIGELLDEMEQIVRNVPVILISLDENGVFTFVRGSEESDSFFNYSKILGKNVWQIAESEPSIKELFERAYKGEPVNAEPFDSSGKHYSIYLNPVKDKNGKITKILGVTYDITETKIAQLELQNALSHIENILAIAPMVLYSLDEKGKFTFVKGGKNIYSSFLDQNLTDKTIWDIIKGNDDVTEDFRKIYSGEIVRKEYNTPDGRHFYTVHYPIKKDNNGNGQENGKVSGVLVSSYEVTGLKKAEEEINILNSTLNNIILNVPVIVFSFDENRRLTYINGKPVHDKMNFSPELLIGKSISDLSVYAKDSAEIIEKAFNGEITSATIRSVQGGEYSLYFSTIKDKNGRITALHGVAYDITEQGELERAAKEATQELEQIINNIPIVVMTLDENGRFILIKGHKVQDDKDYMEFYKGKTIWDIYRNNPAVIELLKEVYSGEEAAGEIDGAFGGVFQMAFIPVKDNNGKVVKVNGIAQNITTLKNTMGQLDRIINSLPILIFEFDASGKPIQIKGREAEKLSEFNFEDSETIWTKYKNNSELLRIFNFAYLGHESYAMYKAKNGRQFQIFLHSVRNNNDELIRVSGIAYDVTASKITEQNLALANRDIGIMGGQIEQILENVPVTIFQIDEKGFYRAIKGKAFKDLRVSEDVFVGKNYKEIYKNNPKVIDSISRALTGEEVSGFVKGNFNKYYFVSYIPNKNEYGLITGVTGMAYDVTIIREAEKNIIRLNEELDQIINNVPTTIFSLNGEGVFEMIKGKDPAKMELEPDKAIGNKVWTMFAEKPEILRFYEKAFSGNEAKAEIPTNNGYYYTTLIPVKNDRGEIEKVIGVSYDITELKTAEIDLLKLTEELEMRVELRTKQLTLLNNELDSYNHSVAHEILNPISAIYMLSESVITKEKELPVTAKEKINIISNSSYYLIDLVKELLQLSTQTNMEAVETEVDMDRLYDNVIHSIHIKNENTKIKKLNDLGITKGNHILLKEVLLNYINNAVKFSNNKENPEIEIGHIKDELEDIYYVKDNGIGFDMKYSDKLFEIFQRLHSKSEYEGTGVGLSITKRIVHKHGGRVWAEGKVNEGATFYFSLPKI